MTIEMFTFEVQTVQTPGITGAFRFPDITADDVKAESIKPQLLPRGKHKSQFPLTIHTEIWQLHALSAALRDRFHPALAQSQH